MRVNSFFGFAHALTHWSACWIFRGCEDNLINFDRLVDYITELEKLYNPLTDHVVHGQCVSRFGYNYWQGGAGFLRSRKTVETLVEIGPSVCKRMNTFEDAFFAQIVVVNTL
jgi:hypothetical protein